MDKVQKHNSFNIITLLKQQLIGWSLFGCIRGYIQKFPDWLDNEVHAYNNKHSLRSNTKGNGGKVH
jgi:hypothetical protein